MRADTTAARAPGSWWQCVVAAAAARPRRMFVVSSTVYPDGTRVELSPDMARTQIGDHAVCEITFGDEQRVIGLELSARGAPKAPPLWFVEVRESTARPPAVSLLAFTGHGQAAGTLVGEGDRSNLAVDSADQVAAVRWYPASGEVDQIYVQPAWRRQGIAGGMLIAAGSLSVARDWPRLWGNGQRTELGEQLRNAAPWHHRAAELTHVAPPMTPTEPSRPC